MSNYGQKGSLGARLPRSGFVQQPHQLEQPHQLGLAIPLRSIASRLCGALGVKSFDQSYLLTRYQKVISYRHE